jgi:hypothetical protein
MLKTKKNKKILSLLGILSMLFFQFLPVYTVQAATITSSLTSGNDVDTSSINTAVSTITNKQSGPSVNVSFSGNTFKNGSTITATATTSGFANGTNANDKLYFTWYLKRDGCDLTDDWWDEDAKKEDSSSKLKSCDMDGDELITPNDWKITAARIIVRGIFDRSDANYSSTAGFVGNSESGTKAEPSVTNVNDGWIKNFRRDDNGDLAEKNNKDAPDCYVQQPSSGIIYELRQVDSVFSDCPSGYHPSCAANTTASCTVLNPDYPDTSSTKSVSNDFGACAVQNEDTGGNTANVFDCTVKSESDLANYTASVSCKNDDETPICTEDDADTSLTSTSGNVLGVIFQKDEIGTSNDTNGVCSALAKPNENDSPLDPPPNFLDNTQPLLSSSAEDCSNLASGLISGVKSDTTIFGLTVENGTVVANAVSGIGPTCTFDKKDNLCKHLFPYFPKKNVTVNGESVDVSDESAGDGKFTLKEKEFWGADPTTASTNGTGKNDEASVIGLGVDSFAWTYASGDKVGVVVEGTSDLASEHNDSSYRTMWAFSKGVCSELEEVENHTSLDEGRRAFYTEENNSIGILTTDFNLDRCLDENLVVPDDNGLSNIKVDLSSTPDNPTNDPSGVSSDSVTVEASVQNVEDLSTMYYAWKIEKSSDGIAVPNENTEWTDITSDMMNKYGSFSTSDQQGIGKRTLIFSLNLPSSVADPDGNGAFYLRVRVTAEENSGTENQIGKGLINIKVKEQQGQIVAYSALAGDDGNLSLNNGVGAEPICDVDSSTCYVTQNQIVGVQIPNSDKDLSGFSWKVNNVSMACTSTISTTACSENDNNALFIPILGNVGESVDAVATALSKKTGSTIEITKHFVIVSPQVSISSADASNAWAKLVGYYKDLNGTKYPDYSTQVFETNAGKTVTFNATVYAAWDQSLNFNWTIDGATQSSNTNQLTFSVDKISGDSYDVGLLLANSHTPEQDKQSNNLRKALLKNWGVSPENSVAEEDISANIQLNVVDNSAMSLLNSKKTGIFASLITNLPQQMMFLLKIVLTSITLMFSMSLLFAFIPESIFEKKEQGYS